LTETLRCGCCGQERPADRVTELGNTPGVYICAGCALWAARRASRFPILRLDPRRVWQRLRPSRGQENFRSSIPIFPTADLSRAVTFYTRLGFSVVERLDGYAVLQSDAIEFHLTGTDEPRTPAEAFMHVGDPARLWKRLKSQELPGLGPLQDQPWGVREFTVTDPDGNRIRIGHPIPEES
jgi:catechol 2,3-dioxygenase-like lactoylglutathione lyase family enzyme